MEPKKNQLWKTITKQPPKKSNESYSNNIHKASEFTKGNIDQIFNGIGKRNSFKEEKNQQQENYDIETQMFLQELEMAVDEVQDMTDHRADEVADSQFKIDLEDESSREMAIVESNPIGPMIKLGHPQLNYWAPGSPGYSQFSGNQFPAPIMDIKVDEERDNLQATRISFLINFIRCLQANLQELSEQHQILKKFVKASFFKYKTWMESLLQKQGRLLRDSIGESLKNSNRRAIDLFQNNMLQQMKVLEEKVGQLQQKNNKQTIERMQLISQLEALETEKQEYIEANFQLQQQITQKDLYVEQRMNDLISKGKLKIIQGNSTNESQNSEISYFNLNQIEKGRKTVTVVINAQKGNNFQKTENVDNSYSGTKLTSGEQWEYEQRIQQYQVQIQKLSQLVDELGSTYEKELAQKQNKLNQEREELSQLAQNLRQKQSQLIERQNDIEELLYQVQANKNEISKQTANLVAKQEQVKEMDSFLKIKMEEMENMEKQLKERKEMLESVQKKQKESLFKGSVQQEQPHRYHTEKSSQSGGQIPMLKLPIRSAYQIDEENDHSEEYLIEEQGKHWRSPLFQKYLRGGNHNLGNRVELRRKLSKSHMLDNEYQQKINLLRSDKGQQSAHMSASFNPSKNYSIGNLTKPTSAQLHPSHIPQTEMSSYHFSRSYANDQHFSSKEKLQGKLIQSPQKKQSSGYENIRQRTEQILNHQIQPREKTKKKGQAWAKVNTRSQDYSDTKLLEVGSKLDRLRQEIKQEIEAVKK